jgi:hypothetical protein
MPNSVAKRLNRGCWISGCAVRTVRGESEVGERNMCSVEGNVVGGCRGEKQGYKKRFGRTRGKEGLIK